MKLQVGSGKTKSEREAQAGNNSSRSNPISRFVNFIRNRNKTEQADLGVSKIKPGESLLLIDKYTVTPPHAEVLICQDPALGSSYRYYIRETELNAEDLVVYDKLRKIISKELQPPEDIEVDSAAYTKEQAYRLAEKYSKSIGKVPEESWNKILYYLVRDMAGYGPLDPMFRDPNIEDISCNGINRPVFVWHNRYESIPTNLAFTNEQVYNDFIIKLAHKGSKHISSSHPILDASLPEKHRLAATFQKEVSTHGSSFCVRKFREDPISIIDQMHFGTINAKLAAYYWMLLENRMNFLILGGTGAGKTSMLNALLSLIPPNDKLITVEEVAELNPPHENWVQLVSRKGFIFGQTGGSSIEIFDLVKLSLRYRPDYLVVGEIRGEEAFNLFQAIATGHGGICTMHSDSLDHAVKRLTSEPMNIAKIYIPLMNLAMYISRVELPADIKGVRFGRRMRDVWEIDDYENYIEISRWDPTTDAYQVDLTKSSKLKHIAELKGLSIHTILAEVDRRERFLSALAKQNIRDQRQVALKIQEYTKTGLHDLSVEESSKQTEIREEAAQLPEASSQSVPSEQPANEQPSTIQEGDTVKVLPTIPTEPKENTPFEMNTEIQQRTGEAVVREKALKKTKRRTTIRKEREEHPIIPGSSIDQPSKAIPPFAEARQDRLQLNTTAVNSTPLEETAPELIEEEPEAIPELEIEQTSQETQLSEANDENLSPETTAIDRSMKEFVEEVEGHEGAKTLPEANLSLAPSEISGKQESMILQESGTGSQLRVGILAEPEENEPYELRVDSSEVRDEADLGDKGLKKRKRRAKLIEEEREQEPILELDVDQKSQETPLSEANEDKLQPETITVDSIPPRETGE